MINVINKSQRVHGTNGRQVESQAPKWLLDAIPELSRGKKKRAEEPWRGTYDEQYHDVLYKRQASTFKEETV